MTRLQFRFDVRAPEASPASLSEIVQATLDLSAWADERGYHGASVSEHHGAEDGYLASPIPMAAAIAARTRKLRISIAALLVPMYEPVKLAEDLVMLDHISEGRAVTTAGIGYREPEFRMFGVEHANRAKVFEEYVDVLLKCWSGERFEWRGRTIQVTPAPYSKPTPPILMGGQSKVAARRAARFGLPFQPANNDDAMNQVYREACQEHGHTPYLYPPGTGEMVWVADDPEREWSRIGEYLLHDALTYAGWQPAYQQGSAMLSRARTQGELMAEGLYKILTPEDCVAYAETLGNEGGLLLYPFCGGTPPEIAWEAMETFDAKVRPRLDLAPQG